MLRPPLPIVLVSSASIAAAVFFAPTAWGDDPPAPLATADSTPLPGAAALEGPTKARLARILAMLGTRAVRKDEISLADIELATILTEAATPLSPDDPSVWRALLAVVSLGDPTDERTATLRRAALEQLGRLDPSDESVRLRRILEVIGTTETAEARIAMYRALLQPKKIESIGKPVAARLALDLALLLQRTGDQPGFEEWLSEAVALDPAFSAAVQMAAGYFRFATDDPAKEAELLIAAMMANPLDPMSIRGLATLLLEHGGYGGASRFLMLAGRSIATQYPIAEYDEVLGDLALAQLASGDPKQAAETVRDRQLVLDDYMRTETAKSDPTLLGDPKRYQTLRYPLRPQLVATRLVAIRTLKDDIEWRGTLPDLWRGCDGVLELRDREVSDATTPEETERTTQRQREAALEFAFAALAFGEDAAKAREYLALAEKTGAISDAARARFEAWVKLRSADPKTAVAAFEALQDDSPLAQLGSGLALEAAGRTRDAAKVLLAVARSSPGTLMGVTAKVRLEAILGAALPPNEVAVALEKVAADVPVTFDRLFAPNAHVIRMRIRHGAPPANVFEPIPATIEIANETSIPLSIDPAGPLRDLVAMQCSLLAAGQTSSPEVPYIMVPINRQFSIPPRGTLTIPIDLAYSDIGGDAVVYVAQGCGLRLRAIANWDTTFGGLRPSTFGDSADSGLIRIEGINMVPAWVEHTLAVAADPRTEQDLVDLVALVHSAAVLESVAAGVADEQKAEFAKVWPILARTLPRLGPVVQAWLLVVLPDNLPALEPALQAVRSSENPLVRLAYLGRRATASSDPVVDAAVRSPDPVIASYGRVMKEMLLHDEEIVRRDFNLSTSGAQKPPIEGDKTAPAPDQKPDTNSGTPPTPSPAPPPVTKP